MSGPDRRPQPLEPRRLDLGPAGKRIDEHVGRLASGDDAVSVARIHSPQGWTEGGQRPEFDEFFLVLSGTLRVEGREGSVEVGAGQAVAARAGRWVRHGTPYPGGAEYLAVCVPAYAPERVHPEAADGETRGVETRSAETRGVETRTAETRSGETAAVETSGVGSTAAAVLPAGEVERLRRLERDHLWHPWSAIEPPAPRRLFVRGSGCYLFDSDGKRYLDARSSSFNAGLGYGRADVVSAVAHQLAELMTFELVDAATAPPVLLAGRLAALLPDRLQRCFFFSGGSEAVEATLKMARVYHRLRGHADKSVCLGFRGGYHGPTLGAMGLCGSAFHQTGSEPMPADLATLPHPGDEPPRSPEESLEAVEAAVEEAGGGARVAAIFLEPIQGNGGVRIPPPGFLAGLRRLCDRHDALLVFDEIMTGCGRTGRRFAFEHWGVVPDVLLLSKCLSAGYMPLSVMVTGEDVYRTFAGDPLLAGFRHGHTCSGHAAACAAGLAVLDALEREELVANCERQGQAILEHLRRVTSALPAVREVRGLGLLVGLELDGDGAAGAAERIAERAAALGLLLRVAGRVLIVAPPLVLGDGERAELLAIVERALSEVLAPGGVPAPA